MARRNLIILAVAITGLAFLAAEADFQSDIPSSKHYHYNSTLFTSFGIAHTGEIEVNPDETGILRLAPDAELDVRVRRFTSRRRLEIRANAAGEPVYYYKEGARERSEDEAKEYLASVMDEVLRRTSVGAEARARRILAEDGLDELLREVSYLGSSSSRRIYLQIAGESENLQLEGAAAIIQTAGREMASSSRLRDTLLELAENLPSEWELNSELAESAERIASGSVKGETLVEIARVRPLGVDDADDFADAISSIASSGIKRQTIISIYQIQPTAEVTEALLAAAATLDSSSDRRRVLTQLVGEAGLPESLYSEGLDIGQRISSSGEKAMFLEAIAEVLPSTDAMHREYIEVSATISSSGERRNALKALIEASWLSPEICREWITSAGGLSSSGLTAGLLVQGAYWCPGGERVLRAYLDAVAGMGSSGDQTRALMALLDRADLDRGLLADLEAFVESNVSSSGERQAIMDRLAEVEPAPAAN